MQLDKVRAILRHQEKVQLASLLTHAGVTLVYYDEGYTLANDLPILLFTADISAPIDDCMALRKLSTSDKDAILNALQEVGTDGEGAIHAIHNVVFSIDIAALDDSTPWSTTGWEQIDHELMDIEKELGDATTAREFQAVASRCRELLISLAQTVFNPLLHPKLDANEVEASDADVKRMLGRYFSSELAGSTHEQYRRLARHLSNNTWDVVNATLHGRNGTYRRALFCVEASKSLINVVAIVSGKRDRAIADDDDIDDLPF